MSDDHKTHYNLSDGDKEHELNSKLTAAADFQGPIKERKCTDPLHMLLLLAAWGVMTAVGIQGVQKGNISVLRRGYDWNGNICTHKSGKPYFYPVNVRSMGVCLEACPTTTDFSTLHCIGGVAPTTLTAPGLVQNGYCLYQLETEQVMNRCLVTNVTALAQFGLMDAYKENGGDYLTNFYGDIIEARAYIFGFGFGIALLLGFAWTYVMRVPSLLYIVIWAMCFALDAFLVILGILMYRLGDEWTKEVPAVHSSNQIWGAKGLAIFFLVLAGLWLCMLVFLRKSINLAIGLVMEGAKAMETMPLIVLYPIAQAAGLVCFLVPWVFWSVFVASLGNFESKSFSGLNNLGAEIRVLRFQYGGESTGYAWFLLFVLFWTSQFIVAMGQVTMALAFSTWYFTRDKSSVSSLTVWQSAKTATYYHFGTAAHGSLIIAIIQTIRAAVTYAQRQAEAATKKMPNQMQWLIRLVGGCVQCCLWCVEKCLKFINKNAYIQTAIYGTPFCTSCKKAFYLIARNIGRIAAVSLVSEFVIIIGKFFISMLSGGLAYYVINRFLATEVSSPIPPTILVIILAWFTAQMFCEVLSMCVATLLQCFIADEEMFEKNPAERFASAELCSYIGQHGGHKVKVNNHDTSTHV